MLIASVVAYKTEGDDESTDPILASYDVEDKDDPAEHPAPLDPSSVPAPAEHPMSLDPSPVPALGPSPITT